jgi:hypothetical protein
MAQGTRDMTVYGAKEGDQLGTSVLAADLNGDGVDDIVVGAPGVTAGDDPRTDQGRAYVFFGSDSVPETVDLADGGFDFTVTGAEGFSRLAHPMASGDLTEYMPEAGAHDDIGLLPRFAALYLLTADPRARDNVLANGGTGGSYGIHYRDQATGMPVSLLDYPYMTLLGRPGDTVNPATKKSEAFPDVSDSLATLTPDSAHQPSIAYLPYLLTGDAFYLDELQFWANYNMLESNPYYRDFEKGLLKWNQVRGQGWALRTLGDAAYITPDTHPLKQYFTDRLRYNLEWYAKEYPHNQKANALGYLANGYAIVYDNYGLAPWQDDFFTSAVGHLVEMGFTDAKPLLDWKAKFVVGRMADPGYCWLHASAYSLQVGNAQKVPFTTWAEVARANGSNGPCAGTAMDGYPDSPTGYGGNMQPALAYAVDAGVARASAAWAQYEKRDPKQGYASSPQFAIVPRSLSGALRTPVIPAASSGSEGVVERERLLASAMDSSLVNRVRGKILLQVEERGEAWYVDPKTGKRFYLKNGAAAYSALRKFGIGITTNDLSRLPMGSPDQPSAAPAVTPAFCRRTEGNIYLQVEARGEAWYIHHCKRYYLKDGNAAYRIMKKFSLGITNADLAKIEVGSLE